MCDLNEFLKMRLKIKDGFVMVMVGFFVVVFKEEDDEEVVLKREKMVFIVKLVKFDDVKKIIFIKEFKNIIFDINFV